MKKIAIWMTSTIFTLISPIAMSIDLDDGCSEVLRYSARDYSIEKSDIGVAVKIYDQYCENDSVKGGTNFSAGLDTVIKAVPFKFSLGSGSTEERTKFFCKTFDSEYKRNESYYRETSQVVSQTTNAWFGCKSLFSQGVIFRPQVAKTQVLIEIARKFAEDVVVQGVEFDTKLLSCTVPNSDSSKKAENATLNTIKTLQPGSWTITCKRIPQQSAGETIYPAADISVGTNRGPFLLPVAADAVFPYQWASEIQQQVNTVSAKLKSTLPNPSLQTHLDMGVARAVCYSALPTATDHGLILIPLPTGTTNLNSVCSQTINPGWYAGGIAKPNFFTQSCGNTLSNTSYGGGYTSFVSRQTFTTNLSTYSDCGPGNAYVCCSPEFPQ